jgi:hypothetical protein
MLEPRLDPEPLNQDISNGRSSGKKKLGKSVEKSVA